MAEARGPTHLLEVCSQKLSEFLFNAEHRRLVWLREIEEEALKMFNSNFSAEPVLMPKTPSQKKHKKKKRSFSFKDENKELTRKRLSRRQSSIKSASFQRLSQSKEGLKSITVEVAAPAPHFKMISPGKEILGALCDKTAIMPAEEEILGIDCNHNIELKVTRNDQISAIPETFTVCSDGHLDDKTENPDAAGIADSSAVVLSHTLEPARTEKDWDSSRLGTSTPKASLDGAPAHQGEELQEGDLSQDLKNSTGTSGGSQLGCRSANRPHRSRRVSLVEKYSLSSKRKSMIRKSISRTIAKKKVARDSSSAATHLSCHSSMEVFMDDETNKRRPSLTQNAELGEASMNMLPEMPCVPMPIDSCAVKNLEMEQRLMFDEERHETKITDSQGSGCEKSVQRSHLHEQLHNSWRQSYKQALHELPAAQHASNAHPSSSSHKTPSPVNKVLSPSGPAKIARPFKNFFQTMQKNQLLKSPASTGHSSTLKSLIKRNIPTRPDSKGDFVEKERQRLESLRKKQEAEQQRKQKVEEEKRRRLEEIKLKREERLRKALQARERVEQMEEEKKRRMEQKIIQHEERNEKVREEEKTKKKTSKKMGEAEARKQKVLQMEEEEKQEQPEKWKTVGEIKRMLEHSSVKQEREWVHGQKDKEKWVKPMELAKVTKEADNLKGDQKPAHLEVPQQEKRVKEANAVPSVGKWLNSTAQQSPVGSSSQVNPQVLRDAKSLKVNPNDYGMDLNSDDSTDDESQPRKPIPSWASGLQLNEAVTYQYYNPPDINKFFGQILSPKLENIFYKSKPRYFKRTSSAVWQSPPLPKSTLCTSNSMKKY